MMFYMQGHKSSGKIDLALRNLSLEFMFLFKHNLNVMRNLRLRVPSKICHDPLVDSDAYAGMFYTPPFGNRSCCGTLFLNIWF